MHYPLHRRLSQKNYSKIAYLAPFLRHSWICLRNGARWAIYRKSYALYRLVTLLFAQLSPLYVALAVFIMGEVRNLVFGTRVSKSKFNLADDNICLKVKCFKGF